MYRTVSAILLVTTLATASPALAGTAADGARQRIEQIATGKINDLAAAYGDKAVLQWVGGPLDGAYASPAEIKEVWTKFVKGQGALKASVSNLAESANPMGSTVTANVVFTGQNTIKVRYAVVYRAGKLVNEVWQVDPNLTN